MNSVVLHHGAIDGVGQCSDVGRCMGVGVEEEERGARNGDAGGGGRVRGERWCPSARGEGLAWG